MSRVYWSTVDARRRTVYTCRILRAEDSAASKSSERIKRDENSAEVKADSIQECVSSDSTLSKSLTVPLIETSVSTARDCTVSALDCGRDKMYRSVSSVSDKVSRSSSALENQSDCDESLASKNISAAESAEFKPHEPAGARNDTAQFAEVCVQDMSSLDTGCVDVSVGCHSSQSKLPRSNSVDNPTAAAEAKTNGSVRLLQANLPAFECIQHHSFADVTSFSVNDKVNIVADAAESDVCAGGLRSDFDRHAQLNCAPLKLISQLDGAVPDSESDASDDEANVPESCDDVFPRSLAATLRRPAAMDHGASGPFKCRKCKRIYRTEEFCAYHSTVCMYEMSSSSSEEPDCDEDEVVDPSDEETDTCCSDEGDDGTMSDYLTSSRNSDGAANCSSLGCQTRNIFLAAKDCDVNANCKILCNSNVAGDHVILKAAEESNSVTDKTKNEVGGEICDVFAETCGKMLHRLRNGLVETVMTSCVAETEEIPTRFTRPTAVDVSVQVDEVVDDLHCDVAASDEQLPDSGSHWHGNVAGRSNRIACESQTSSELSASVPCCVGSIDQSEAHSDGPNRGKDLMEAEYWHSDFHPDSNRTESMAAVRNDSGCQQITSVSRAVFNAVSSGASLAGEHNSPLLTSNEAVVSSHYDSGKDFSRTALSSCTSPCLQGGQNAASGTLLSNANAGFLWKTGLITSSSSLCLPSQQYAVKPQDVLSSSASMVWPTATVFPGIVNKSPCLSVSSDGVHTQMLAAPWVPIGVLTTASIVIPTALPNAAWVRPLNVTQPVYAITPRQIQSGSFVQPIQLLPQFVRPALVTPMTWLAPQLAVMNAVELRHPLALCPAVTSACSPSVSSQQSLSSTFAANVLSAGQRPGSSLYETTAAEHSSHVVQKTVSSMTVHTATQVTTACPQLSGLTLPTVASLESLQSAIEAAPSCQQSRYQLVFAAAQSQAISVPLPAVTVPSLCSSSFTTSVKQPHVSYNPLASLMHHISSATAYHTTSSKNYISVVDTSSTWSTCTTPVTVSCLSNRTCEQRENLTARFTVPRRCDMPVSTCGIETGRNTDVAALKFDRLLPEHTDTATAQSLNMMTCQSTNTGHLFLPSSADILKPQRGCSATLSTSFIPSSSCLLPISSWNSGTVCAAMNLLPVVGNGAKSPRLTFQLSSPTINRQSEVLKNRTQSVLPPARNRTQSVLPPARNGRPSLPVSSCASGRPPQTCDIDFIVSNSSPIHSRLAGNIVTSLSNCCNLQVSRALPSMVTSAACLLDSVCDQQICSTVNNTETESLAGNYNSTGCVSVLFSVIWLSVEQFFILTFQKPVALLSQRGCTMLRVCQ